MGILQILLLLPVLIQSVESFLPGVPGTSKLATVFKILEVVLKYPSKIVGDISKADWKTLATDVVAILVDAANTNGIFHHGDVPGPTIQIPIAPDAPHPATVNKGS